MKFNRLSSVSVYEGCGKHTKTIGDDYMDEQKYSYYVNIQSHGIYSEPNEAEWDFKINATESQVALLERMFDKTDETDSESYIRAHIPYLEYHHQPENKEYDQHMVMIYTLLYYLGDEKARTHIRSMGILSGEILKEQPTQGGQEF